MVDCIPESKQQSPHFRFYYGDRAIPANVRTFFIRKLQEELPGSTPLAFVSHGSNILGWATDSSDYDGNLIFAPSKYDAVMNTKITMPVIVTVIDGQEYSVTPVDIRKILIGVNKSSEMTHFVVSVASKWADWQNGNWDQPWEDLYYLSELRLSPMALYSSLRGKILSTIENALNGRSKVISRTLLALLMSAKLSYVMSISRKWDNHLEHLYSLFEKYPLVTNNGNNDNETERELIRNIANMERPLIKAPIGYFSTLVPDLLPDRMWKIANQLYAYRLAGGDNRDLQVFPSHIQESVKAVAKYVKSSSPPTREVMGANCVSFAVAYPDICPSIYYTATGKTFLDTIFTD